MKGEARAGSESSTEAYEDEREAGAGACAADYWVGPGVNRPALDGKGVSLSLKK